jgi:glycosyltransferase involved in cell wall biosynthesis
LIKSFNLLIKNKKYKKLNLIIGGRAGWKNQKVFNLVNKLKLNSKINFTGFIEDKDLATVYSQSLCNCYISLYEGFGLPPLEAQSCGCPVLSSNISSIPEVLNKSAVLINPYKVKEIKEGLIKVLKNNIKYKDLGLKNSKKYTWNKTAKNLIKIINNV